MKRKILIIDDDRANLQLLAGFIRLGENADHDVITCVDGFEGIEALKKAVNDIDVVLLDRAMPVMSGVEFLMKRNENEKLKKIPVIMQTASGEKENVIQGFKLGVYHYLVKPYSPVIFNSIVRAAILLYSTQRTLTTEVDLTHTLLKFMDQAVFKVNKLEEAEAISLSLATLFPKPDKTVLGITEIIINAHEHGNLGISYDEKTELNLQSKWREEILKRESHANNRNKTVFISYFKTKSEIILNIRDQGPGFDFKKYLEFDVTRSTDNHGRGIAFANNLSFDKLEYIGTGSEVNCVVKL